MRVLEMKNRMMVGRYRTDHHDMMRPGPSVRLKGRRLLPQAGKARSWLTLRSHPHAAYSDASGRQPDTVHRAPSLTG